MGWTLEELLEFVSEVTPLIPEINEANIRWTDNVKKDGSSWTFSVTTVDFDMLVSSKNGL